jgi:hypothetical protein
MNNRADNLEWLSRADNIRHGFKNGLYSTSKKTTLTDLETQLSYTYRSEAAAGIAIGKNPGYIHSCIKNNRKAVGADKKAYSIKIERI